MGRRSWELEVGKPKTSLYLMPHVLYLTSLTQLFQLCFPPLIDLGVGLLKALIRIQRLEFFQANKSRLMIRVQAKTYARTSCRSLRTVCVVKLQTDPVHVDKGFSK